MTWIGRVVVCLALSLSFALAEVSSIRWCTISSHEETKCVDMKTAFQNNNLKTLECVAGDDVKHCMELINTNKADLITLDGGDVYEAGKKFNMIPIMQEVYANDNTGYYAIAVAKKDSGVTLNNLRGKKSCHTGVKKTAGWNVPVGYLLEKNMIIPLDCQDDIRAAGQFFNASCAPGAMSAKYDPNGDNPPNLCDLCFKQDGNRCPRDTDEPYYGYDGAFRCLVQGGGDVAFIKPVTVTQNTNGRAQAGTWADGLSLRSDDYILLCQDGTTAAIGNEATCHLAFVPSHAVMASRNFDAAVLQDFRSVLNRAQALFGSDVNNNGFSMFDSSLPSYGGAADLLFKDSAESLREVVGKEYTEYLGTEYLETLQGLDKCPAGSARWCVTSSQEKKKCRAMRDAFRGASLPPPLSCFETDSSDDCAREIAGDRADLVSLDGGELYKYGKLHGVVPIMAEDYGAGEARYYAVVVVKRSTTFTINDLKGKKSCHTGYGRTVGWNVPIGFLINRGDIKVDDKCQIPQAVGKFFNASCVPGVLEPGNNPYNNNPENLCAICGSTGADKCKPSASEIYQSYNGAFRCMVEGAGDVAFVKHTTVDSNTGGANTDPWARNLRKTDYQLLCPDGTRAEVDDWMNCNLAKAPSHAVVTAEGKTEQERQQYRDLLNEGQKRFNGSTGFQMFDSEGYGQDGRNLIFKDSTFRLIPTTSDTDTYDTFISKEYLKDIEAVSCDQMPGGSAVVVLPSFLLTLAALGAQRLLNRG